MLKSNFNKVDIFNFITFLQLINFITSLQFHNFIIISIIAKSLEYAILLFRLLIVQKGLTALFNFDDGYLESIP